MTRCVAFLVALTLALPARADCAKVSVAAGEVLTPEAAECLRGEIVRLIRERDDERTLRKEAETALAASEATANITCPPDAPPVVPVAIAAVLGVAAGAIGVALALLAIRL